MKKTIITLIASAFICLPSLTLAEYPEKPVNFIVPWPPGDLEDILTRLIAEDFQTEYGVAAAVVNKPGGGGGPFPGAIDVATAPADGYTIGSFVIGVPVIGHKIDIAELTPAKFEPLGIFVTYPFVLAAAGDAPFKTMSELAIYGKSNKLALGHFGGPLIPTKVSLAFAKNSGFEWGSEAAFDMLDCNTLASGDADVINTTLQLILPCLDKVTILASMTGQRIPLTPNAPTMKEVDPSLAMELWNGLFVRKETPQSIRDKISAVAKKTMMGPRAQKIASDTGAAVYWKDAATSAAQIVSDQKDLAGINAKLN